MSRIKVGIIGSGNVGTDLIYKIMRSPLLEVGLVMGIDHSSQGLARAEDLGLRASSDGINALIREPSLAQIVIDATTAKAHLRHASILNEIGKRAIDLTPAHIGEMVVPIVNIGGHMDKNNICLISCGAQATIPIISAIHSVCPVDYAEIVSTISSASAGSGTRSNIDEFTQTTREGIIKIVGVKNAKVIIILNPANPPIMMHNTIYTRIIGPFSEKVTLRVKEMENKMRHFVPGYKLKVPPLIKDDIVTTMVQVTGRGDFLPPYAGNLDIITAAAVQAAEILASNMIGQG